MKVSWQKDGILAEYHPFPPTLRTETDLSAQNMLQLTSIMFVSFFYRSQCGSH